MKRTIYLVEDNTLVQEALRMMIEDEPDMEVCGVAQSSAEALVAIPDIHPTLVLTDLSLSGMNGIELIERLRIVTPGQRAAILSGARDPAYAERALAAGAKGYILKGGPLDIMEGIRQVLDGEVYVSPSVRAPESRRAGSH